MKLANKNNMKMFTCDFILIKKYDNERCIRIRIMWIRIRNIAENVLNYLRVCWSELFV
jgi:hypothetical protein